MFSFCYRTPKKNKARVMTRKITSLHIFVSGLLFASMTEEVIGQNATLKFSDESFGIELGETKNVTLSASQELTVNSTLIFTYHDKYVDYGTLVEPVPNITVKAGDLTWPLSIIGNNPGHLLFGVNSSLSEVKDVEDVFIRIDIVHSSDLIIINAVIGWIYFAAWSVSFYPQIFYNWQRKSVVGLNFDFLSYNLTGFLCYGFFNIGMFWVPTVMDEYKRDHPRGINPVQLNDVIFTIHAVFVTVFTICQCIIYERKGQRVSKVCMILLIAAWLFSGIALIVVLAGHLTWLTFLYYLSYIKLGITLIKYVPQAYMNFRRKSTVGWSIGNILLDFTGGSLSMLQMILLSYNSDDWASIFGDPTKFGLGLFSIMFDCLFITQHFVLYRNRTDYDRIRGYEVSRDEPAELKSGQSNPNYNSTRRDP